MSTFSEFIGSQSSFDEDPTESRPKTIVKVPPAPCTLTDIYVEQKQAHYRNYKPPNWEEEAALFDATGVPAVRFPLMPSKSLNNSNGEVPENMKVNPSTSTYDDILALFHTERDPIVNFPQVPSSAVSNKNGLAPVQNGIQTSPTHEEEKALFDTTLAPRISISPFTVVFNVEYTASNARQAMSIPTAPRSFDEVTVAESHDLFDNVIRVRLPPAPEQVFVETSVSGLEETEDDVPTTSASNEQNSSSSSDSNMVTRPADLLARQSKLEDSTHPKPAFKFNAEAENFVPEKKCPASTLNAEAPDFIPLAQLNPQAEEFVPQKQFQNSKLNPAAAVFVPQVQLDPEEWAVIPRETQQSSVPEQESRDPIPMMQDTFDFSDREQNSDVHQEDDEFVPMMSACYRVYNFGKDRGYYDPSGDFTLLTPVTHENDGYNQTSDFADGTDEGMKPMQLDHEIYSHQHSPGYHNEAGFFIPFAQATYGVSSYEQNSGFIEEDNEFISTMSGTYATYGDYPQSGYYEEAGDFDPLAEGVQEVYHHGQDFNGNGEEGFVVPMQTAFNPDQYAYPDEFVPDEPTYWDPVAQVFQTYEERMAASAIVAENAIARGTVPYEETTPEQQEYQRQHRLPDFVKPPATGRYSANHRVECHHFSFFGQPEQHRNATPPQRSFAIICGAPKLKLACDLVAPVLRREVCLHNATHLVDPVVFYGNLDDFEGLSGYQLEKAVKGSVHKAYSGNGRWREDKYDDSEDTPQFDPMNRVQDEDDETYFNATNRLDYLTQPRALEIADDIVNEAKRKALHRETFVPSTSRMFDVFPVGDSGFSDIEDENAALESEAASDAGSIHLDCAVSPLKVVKTSHAVEKLEQSCIVPPLHIRKVSGESSLSLGESAESEGSGRSHSTATSPTPSETTEAVKTGTTTPEASDLELSSATMSSPDQQTEVEKDKCLSIVVYTPPKVQFSAPRGNMSLEVGAVPFDLPIRFKPQLKPLKVTDLLYSCKDTPALVSAYRQVEAYTEQCPPKVDGHKLVRSPECIDLYGAGRGERYDLVDGNERVLYLYRSSTRDRSTRSVSEEQQVYVPHQLSPIKEEDPSHDFYSKQPMNLEEINEVGANKAEPEATAQTPITPTHYAGPGLKRQATIVNLSGAAKEQGNWLPIVRASGQPTGFSEHVDSPVMRPAALSPRRMLGDTESGHQTSDPENEIGSLARNALVVSPPRHSEVFGEQSPVRSPRAKNRFDETYPPGQWLSQKSSVAGEGQHTARPVTPPGLAIAAQPVSPPQAAASSTIGRAMPGLLSSGLSYASVSSSVTLVAIQTTTPPGMSRTSRLGVSAAAYFEHIHQVEPSPTRSFIGSLFADFSGVQRAAADLGEYPPGTLTSPSQAQPQPSPLRVSHLLTSHTAELMTEDLLPSTHSHGQDTPQTPRRSTSCLSSISPILSRCPRFTINPQSSISSASTKHNEPSEYSAATDDGVNPFEATQPRSVREVLFSRTTRTRRVDGSLRPSLRASSWGVVGNKLREAQKHDADGKKDGKKSKGNFGNWIDRVFGFVKR